MGIDTSIYEAAEIDGANVFQRIFKVTIPCIMPTMVILGRAGGADHDGIRAVAQGF